MKTKGGAKKRFRITGSGKIKRKHAYKSHILTKKSKKRKRNLGYDAIVHKADEKNVKRRMWDRPAHRSCVIKYPNSSRRFLTLRRFADRMAMW